MSTGLCQNYVLPVMQSGLLNLICHRNTKNDFSYFHSAMTYNIILWGISPHSIHSFRLQKRVIRIITNSRSGDSWRELFKKLKRLPLQSQHIFFLLLFMVKKENNLNVILRFIVLIYDRTTISFILYVV
jgi:hypothetical protein